MRIRRISLVLFSLFVIAMVGCTVEESRDHVELNPKMTEPNLITERVQEKSVESEKQDVQKEQEKNMDQQKQAEQEVHVDYVATKTKNPQTSEKIAYLTFDDGPSAITPKVLDILDKYNVKASFFVIGNNTEFGKQMYKRIVDSGHAIGNHSYSHDYKTIYRSTTAFKKDFNRLQDLLEHSIGFRPQILRFPGGSDNTVSWKVGGKRVMYDLTRKVLDEGYMYFDWNADSEDAQRVNNNKDVIIRAVLSKSRGKNSVIVLMHDAPGRRTTVDALPTVIEGLKAQGFTFRTLSPDSFTVHLLRPD